MVTRGHNSERIKWTRIKLCSIATFATESFNLVLTGMVASTSIATKSQFACPAGMETGMVGRRI